VLGRRRDRVRIAWAYAALVALAVVGALVVWRAVAASTGLDVSLWPGYWPVRWARPWAFALGPLAIAVWWIAVHARRTRSPTLLFSRTGDADRTRAGWVARTASLPAVLRVVALLLLVAALAQPQAHRVQDIELEGIDVMFVLDMSQSMEASDLAPTRLHASQRVIREFVGRRHGDRVGLVIFGSAPMVMAPLTLDVRALDEIVADLTLGDVPPRGTAIGDALGLALAVLRRSDADSRVVILLSDGDSNVTTELSPHEAKILARDTGVRVFTVLMGAEQHEDEYGVDPELLQAIAGETGGAFFRATDSAALEATFREVRENLDTTRRELRSGTPGSEIFGLFAWPAVFLLFLEMALRLTRWRRFP
jgi:Ca-activated chloride channel homolog